MTVKQSQCLLCYLGYYAGPMDGIRGSGTRAAEAQFHRDYGDGETDTALLEALSGKRKKKKKLSFWDDIRYFRREEFRCRCGKCGGFPAEPEEKLVRIADDLRAHLGKPAAVSSGVRCREHNAAVGGAAGSRHLSGKAMDFSVAGVSSSKLLALVSMQPGIRYAYAIDGSHVHMDVA